MKRIFLNKHKIIDLSLPYTIQNPSYSKTFGDNLICATFCSILNYNGIPSVLNNDLIKDLVECPIFNPNDGTGPIFRTNSCNKYKTGNVYDDLAEGFERQFNMSVKMPDKYPVPTKFVPMDIDSVDVAVTTKAAQNFDKISRSFTNSHGCHRTFYKQWPYFDELFSLFDKYNISYIDLNKNNIVNYEFLNYIRHCKVYLGLDAGAAHYASKEGAGKTLIIQNSFFSSNEFFGKYDFEIIQIPCGEGCTCYYDFTNTCYKCNNDYKCIKDISPEVVLECVLKKMEEHPYARASNYLWET